MAITKRGEKTWLVRIYLGRDRHGKRKWYSETVKGSKRDAQRVERAKQAKRDQGVLRQATRATVETYLYRWLEEAAKQKVRARTFASYRQVVEAYILPELGLCRLARLSPLDIQGMVNRLIARGLSSRTVRYAVTVLRMALTQAVRWELLPSSPVQAGSLSLPKREATVTTSALSVEEAHRLFAAAKGTRFEAVWPLAVTSAMRPGEYLALKWEDVNFADGEVSVRRTLQPAGRFAEPKTEKSRRTLALPRSTMHALREHKRRQAAEKLAAGAEYTDQGLVFCTALGGPLDYYNFSHYQWLPLLKRAELRHVRLYDLRHTGATLLLQAGENLKVVSERLGHANITLTADVYTHVTKSMQKKAAERLEQALGSA